MLASFLCCIAVAHGIPADAPLPEDWRHPTAAELHDAERNESPDRYARVVADFNGDGRGDTALLLKRRTQSAEALWILLSEEQADYRWIKVIELPWGAGHPDVPLAMGIDKVDPGVIAYGCLDDAGECNFGPLSERPKLELKSPSLMYFKFGSAASLYFWSNKHRRFMRAWLSD